MFCSVERAGVISIASCVVVSFHVLKTGFVNSWLKKNGKKTRIYSWRSLFFFSIVLGINWIVVLEDFWSYFVFVNPRTRFMLGQDITTALYRTMDVKKSSSSSSIIVVLSCHF